MNAESETRMWRSVTITTEHYLILVGSGTTSTGSRNIGTRRELQADLLGRNSYKGILLAAVSGRILDTRHVAMRRNYYSHVVVHNNIFKQSKDMSVCRQCVRMSTLDRKGCG